MRPIRKEDEEDIDYLYYENDPNDESREWDAYFMEDKTLIKYGMLPIFYVPSYSHKYTIFIDDESAKRRRWKTSWQWPCM